METCDHFIQQGIQKIIVERILKSKIMTNFKLKGNDLYDSKNHRVATMKGNNLYDSKNHKVATIKGNNLYDSKNHKVATLNGSDIRDSRNHKIASISDAKKAIDGAMGGMSVVALWVCFIRWKITE